METSTFQETSKTSYSLTRTPGPRNESIKGSSTNLPFLPGGLDKKENPSVSALLANLDIIHESDENEEKLFEELFDKSENVIRIIDSAFKMLMKKSRQVDENSKHNI